MKRHIKIYCDYFGISEQDDKRLCEHCRIRLITDIHHIKPRGMGGKNEKVDVIENLIGLCRNCHILAESKKLSKEYLFDIHYKNLKQA